MHVQVSASFLLLFPLSEIIVGFSIFSIVKSYYSPKGQLARHLHQEAFLDFHDQNEYLLLFVPSGPDWHSNQTLVTVPNTEHTAIGYCLPSPHALLPQG